MKVGFTYDLRDEYLAAGFSAEETAEFDRLETIEAIACAVTEVGHRVERIGSVRRLVERLAGGERWDLVFNICEGLRGRSREAQVPAILEAYDIPHTFSDALVMALTLDKGLTKTVVRAAGVPTPDFAVIAATQDLARFKLPFPVFAKPIAEGTGKGVTPASKIDREEDLKLVCAQLLRQFRQPVLVEQFLPGREFTIGLWGTGERAEVIGTMEILLLDAAEPQAYTLVNKERCEELVEYRLGQASTDPTVRRAEEIALAAWRSLECRDAGRVDLRCDAFGQPCFLEVNPLAGLHPAHSDLPILCSMLNISYQTLIARIMESAESRLTSPAAGS